MINCVGYFSVFSFCFSSVWIPNLDFSVKLTKRTRKRKLTSDAIVLQDRYVLNYVDPKSCARKQAFFEKKKEAEARQRELMNQVAEGTYIDPKALPTIGEAIDHWLSDKEGKLKPSTLLGYKIVANCIRGPILDGSAKERFEFTANGKKPKGANFVAMLGPLRLTDLTTAAIRAWHRTLVEMVGNYTANRAKAHLKSILALAEEDFGVRVPSMPTGLQRQRHKPKKVILASTDIQALIRAAKTGEENGIYYAFPFLAGTRPSEQLGLLWEDVDFVANVIRIRRIQERDGSLVEMTKTEAGTREIPMGATLREMLLAWRIRCPRAGKARELHRVFPGPGRLQPWPKPRIGGGGPLAYQNFRRRYWEAAFERLKLPYVTPHSARHSFISTLQAQGIEVGLVAQIAGHANPTVTLGHYTQAVRSGSAAIEALDRAYAS